MRFLSQLQLSSLIIIALLAFLFYSMCGLVSSAPHISLHDCPEHQLLKTTPDTSLIDHHLSVFDSFGLPVFLILSFVTFSLFLPFVFWRNSFDIVFFSFTVFHCLRVFLQAHHYHFRWKSTYLPRADLLYFNRC